MNEYAYTINASDKELSDMTAYEICELRRKTLGKFETEYDRRKKAILADLNNIEVEYDCRKKAIYYHYEHYTNVANERLKDRILLEDLINRMDAKDLKSVLNSENVKNCLEEKGCIKISSYKWVPINQKLHR